MFDRLAHAGLSRPADITLRELDRVIVAGKTEPVVIYELLDVDSEEVKDQKLRSAERFAEGLHCYRAGQFRDARLLFADCLVNAPLDETAALYIGRWRVLRSASRAHTTLRMDMAPLV